MKTLFSALDSSVPHPFNSLVARYTPTYIPDDINGDGVLLLWGGGDISPFYYNQKPGQFTGADDRPCQRDAAEAALAKAAIEKDIPIIGICRGAQLLCAMSGGKVIQHVNNHGQNHLIETRDGRKILSSSLHHQMMFPWDIEHELFAWSSNCSTVFLGEDNEELEFPAQAYRNGILIEPEVVWFPTTKTLAIQGHPEFMDLQTPFVQYSLELMTHLCLK